MISSEPFDFEAQFGHLPGDILLSLALNDNAPYASRKAAVRLMYVRGDRQATAPTIESLLKEVRLDIDAEHEVVAIVEQAIEAPLPTGASVAGVTTKTMQAVPVHG